MLMSILSNKYTATIVVVLGVIGYAYIFKPASMFDENGALKSKILTPELIALGCGLATYFIVGYLTASSPQEVVVVGGSGDGGMTSPAAASVPQARRADALLTAPFARRR